MTFTAGSIADGQLATGSPAALYTVPGSTKAYLKTLTLVNTNAASQTILLYITRSGGTPRLWRRFVLAQYESGDAIDTSLELSAGDAITGVTTTASAVDYTITGVLET